ncbi:MAG: hypothetical protein LE168_05590, partial [Endomicrobium sp.]|nr:hypothetical protein [Endomicrobium sp.]
NYNVAKTIDLNTSVFYSSLYGNRNTNVLVRFTQDEDVSEISHGDELDKHMYPCLAISLYWLVG